MEYTGNTKYIFAHSTRKHALKPYEGIAEMIGMTEKGVKVDLDGTFVFRSVFHVVSTCKCAPIDSRYYCNTQ